MLLVKGLNFCLPPKQLNYADYLVHFEFFYRDIHNLEILSNSPGTDVLSLYCFFLKRFDMLSQYLVPSTTKKVSSYLLVLG